MRGFTFWRVRDSLLERGRNGMSWERGLEGVKGKKGSVQGRCIRSGDWGGSGGSVRGGIGGDGSKRGERK